MMTPAFAIAAVLVTGITLTAGYTQSSSLHLREERQPMYWPRYGTSLSGRYHNRTWIPGPERTSYGEFRGGGPGAGK
ncbi:MAG: hypothetical protein KME12_01250 [Trichocoleus desertorum ATA4-8-CV12]|nr:hypothetical protein [Trichocoleus desertorum ATA4-8-CV12]